MKINRDNYESFLVDYTEGSLSENMRQEVEKFLLLNVDIQQEFDLFNDSSVEPCNTAFSEKDDLKRIPLEKTATSSEYFQQLCVSYIDKDLSESDSDFLNNLINTDAEKQHELNLYKKTKLVVEDLIYNEKLLLKQPDIIHQINNSNFEEYCVASIEGWLDQAGLIALNNYIAANPNSKRVLNIYHKTRLTPDLSIVYPDKRKIKRFTILSPSIKKYISVISSVAAALVLALMIFYTTTLADKSQLTSSLSGLDKENTDITPKANKNLVLKKEGKKEQTKSVLHDPFGFEKINSQKPIESTKANKRLVINPIKPIRVTEIECPPCKQIFDNKYLAYAHHNSYKSLKSESVSNQKENRNPKNKDAVWKLAQAGISELNKITNSELTINRTKKRDKTKVAFNSKLFSFSTQVNKNR